MDSSIELRFDLTISSGNGLFTSVTGTITLDAVVPAHPRPSGPGSASGTITGPPIPTGKRDCMNNGWRTVADDRVQPFKNQGQCIAFVQHQ